MQIVKAGQIYYHCKGGIYKVIAVGNHSETKRRMVVYCLIDKPDDIWIRPESMWSEIVKKPNYTGPRFTLMEDVK